MTGRAATHRSTAVSALCHDASGVACSPCGPRIIGLSFAANAVSPVVKGVVGLLCGSQALVADAAHSLADTASFGINYVGSRSNRLTPLAQGILIGSITFLAGVWIYTDNIAILIVGERSRPGVLGPIVAGVSLLMNLYLYSISACAHRRSPNTATLFCTIQNKTNCYASLLALVGMMLADLGLTYADPLCAVLIGFSLFTTAFEMCKQAFANAPAGSARTRKQKQLVFMIVGALSIAVAGYAASDVIGRNDVILVPAAGPTLASPVDELLGRAPHLLVVNTEEHTLEPILNGYRSAKGDVSGGMLKIVGLHEVDVVLAKKVGQEMFDDLQAADVRIYYVHDPISVDRALSRFHGGRYELATEANVGQGFGRSKVRWLAPW